METGIHNTSEIGRLKKVLLQKKKLKRTLKKMLLQKMTPTLTLRLLLTQRMRCPSGSKRWSASTMSRSADGTPLFAAACRPGRHPERKKKLLYRISQGGLPGLVPMGGKAASFPLLRRDALSKRV